jgi:DNA (cytosine-5)-methyltransferase 1
MHNKYKVLDLFSGAGGMAEGFIQAGFEIACATDYSKEAAVTYINRHKQLGYNINYFNGDITTLTNDRNKFRDFLSGNNIDVVVGGPPCQGFSLSGKRSEDDFRNLLFLDFLKAIKMTKPNYFVMENVEGMLSYKFERIVGLDNQVYEDVFPQKVIENEALKMGYFVKWKLLNAKDFGVPQFRPRVIFLGHRIRKLKNGTYKNLVHPPKFPEIQSKIVTVEDAISDLNFLKNGGISEKYDKRFGNKSTYQINLKRGLTPKKDGDPIESTVLFNHQASNHMEKTLERFKLLKEGESISLLMQRLSDGQLEKYSTKKFRCTKLNRKDVSPTVLTLPDDIVHYDDKNPRILTVRELARLQSFDDSFEFLGKRTTGGKRRKFETPQYTQVGNAVPPLFAKAIAQEIIYAIQQYPKITVGVDQSGNSRN